MLVWRSAARLPTVIESTARIHSAGAHTSEMPGRAWYMIRRKATKPAALELTDR